jgi:hypothetical protein
MRFNVAVLCTDLLSPEKLAPMCTENVLRNGTNVQSVEYLIFTDRTKFEKVETRSNRGFRYLTANSAQCGQGHCER